MEAKPFFLPSQHGGVGGLQSSMKMASKGEGRTPKPPKPPEKPLMPYMRYSRKVWEQVKNSNPHLKLWEVGKIIGQMWRELPDDEKTMYVEEYDAEKTQYTEALRQYHSSPAYQAWLLAKERAEKIMEEQDQERRQSSMRARDRVMDPTQTDLRESYILEDNEEDAEDQYTAKHVAAARFQRNHRLMQEILSDARLPDPGQLITQSRLNTLRSQVEQLKNHKRNLCQEIEGCELRHHTRLERIKEDSDKFVAEYEKITSARPMITEAQFADMIVKAKGDLQREEEERLSRYMAEVEMRRRKQQQRQQREAELTAEAERRRQQAEQQQVQPQQMQPQQQQPPQPQQVQGRVQQTPGAVGDVSGSTQPQGTAVRISGTPDDKPESHMLSQQHQQHQLQMQQQQQQLQRQTPSLLPSGQDQKLNPMMQDVPPQSPNVSFPNGMPNRFPPGAVGSQQRFPPSSHTQHHYPPPPSYPPSNMPPRGSPMMMQSQMMPNVGISGGASSPIQHKKHLSSASSTSSGSSGSSLSSKRKKSDTTVPGKDTMGVDRRGLPEESMDNTRMPDMPCGPTSSSEYPSAPGTPQAASRQPMPQQFVQVPQQSVGAPPSSIAGHPSNAVQPPFGYEQQSMSMGGVPGSSPNYYHQGPVGQTAGHPQGGFPPHAIRPQFAHGGYVTGQYPPGSHQGASEHGPPQMYMQHVQQHQPPQHMGQQGTPVVASPHQLVRPPHGHPGSAAGWHQGYPPQYGPPRYSGPGGPVAYAGHPGRQVPTPGGYGVSPHPGVHQPGQHQLPPNIPQPSTGVPPGQETGPTGPQQQQPIPAPPPYQQQSNVPPGYWGGPPQGGPEYSMHPSHPMHPYMSASQSDNSGIPHPSVSMENAPSGPPMHPDSHPGHMAVQQPQHGSVYYPGYPHPSMPAGASYGPPGNMPPGGYYNVPPQHQGGQYQPHGSQVQWGPYPPQMNQQPMPPTHALGYQQGQPPHPHPQQPPSSSTPGVNTTAPMSAPDGRPASRPTAEGPGSIPNPNAVASPQPPINNQGSTPA